MYWIDSEEKISKQILLPQKKMKLTHKLNEKKQVVMVRLCYWRKGKKQKKWNIILFGIIFDMKNGVK